MRRFAAAVLVALFSVPAATAGRAPHVEERIVPGRAIGKVALGMSLAQVRRILGPPELAFKPRRAGFNDVLVEYSWSFSDWRVAFRIHRGKGRAVQIRYTGRRERTAEGVGFGTVGARVISTYNVGCRQSWWVKHDLPPGFIEWDDAGQACILRSRGGAQTIFLVREQCAGGRPLVGLTPCLERDRRMAVGEVVVVAAGQPLPVFFDPQPPG